MSTLTSSEMESVDCLRRRPPGDKVLIYLDQSTLSALAREDSHRDTRELLRRGVEADRWVCLLSLEHADETLLAPYDSWNAIDRLSDELAIGIRFHARETIEGHELTNAAAEFLDQPPEWEAWEEAFHDYPHTPRDDRFDELFGGRIRIRARFDPTDWGKAEVEHEKSKEEGMTRAYEELREAGFSFDEMAEANLREMISWKLGPLVDPERFRGRLARRVEEFERTADIDNPDVDPGSPYTRMMAPAQTLTFVKRLAEHFPGLAERSAEFGASAALRRLPTLSYPARFRAALAATPGRKGKAGDGYDIEHLTKGLSRCDIVTADSGMTQLARSFHLVPSGCELFGVREHEALDAALKANLE